MIKSAQNMSMGLRAITAQLKPARAIKTVFVSVKSKFTSPARAVKRICWDMMAAKAGTPISL
jgi:hypothetical protein